MKIGRMNIKDGIMQGHRVDTSNMERNGNTVRGMADASHFHWCSCIELEMTDIDQPIVFELSSISKSSFWNWQMNNHVSHGSFDYDDALFLLATWLRCLPLKKKEDS